MASDHNVDGAGAGAALLVVGVVSLQVEVSVPDRWVAYSSGASFTALLMWLHKTIFLTVYSKTCLKRPLKKKTKIVFLRPIIV